VVQNRCEGSGGGGGLASDSVGMVFDYNDVWQNYPNDYYECTAGPHALSGDPLFVAAPFGDYCLSQTAAGQPENSPCLDAGDTLLMTAPLDLDSLVHAWTTRTDSVPDAGATDIGYHYVPWPATGIAASPSHGTEANLRFVPNPARGRYVRLAGHVRSAVTLFDAAGRVVLRVSARSDASDGLGLLDISGLSAGVYLVRAEAGGPGAPARLLVLR
jgi:hypothetical protein